MTATPPATASDHGAVLALHTVGPVLLDALRKFDPRYLWHNPVLLLTEIGAALTTLIAVAEPFVGGAMPSGGTAMPAGFTGMLAIGFWACLFTATLAESIAEGRGRSQTASLRRAQPDTTASRVADYDRAKDPAARSAVARCCGARPRSTSRSSPVTRER